MSCYLYPAIFDPEEGKYNVTFPDLPDCYTCGDNLTDAMMMAQDILSDVLADHEETGEPYAPLLMPVTFMSPVVACVPMC